jgi:isochorismate synthase EntC
MKGATSFLDTWVDSEFWSSGAFLVSEDGETVTLGKGLNLTLVNSFKPEKPIVFYLKDFYSDSFLSWRPSSFITISKATILSWLTQWPYDHSHISPLFNDDDLYEKDFNLLNSAFNETLKKVVLISRETYLPFEKEKSIKRLFKKAFEFGTGTPYGVWDQGFGMIGSTPELLLSACGRELQTFALAGTARLGEEQELWNSVKDRHEHDLVIQDICEKLEAFSESVTPDKTGIHPFKNIIHLRTNIKARLKDSISWSELIAALSPTAALGGYPKDLSLKFLSQTHYARKYDRRFGSAFGIICEESQHVVVSIRNVQWQEGHLFIESGGGVVPESELKNEMEEIRLKRNTIRNHYL